MQGRKDAPELCDAQYKPLARPERERGHLTRVARRVHDLRARRTLRAGAIREAHQHKDGREEECPEGA